MQILEYIWMDHFLLDSMQWQKYKLCNKSPCKLYTACVSCGHSDLSSGVSWWNMQRLLVCPLCPTYISVSWLEEKPAIATSRVLWADWRGTGQEVLRSSGHLTTMRCPFLALYTIGSGPVLKSTALSLPAWISILMLDTDAPLFRWHNN